MKSIFQLCRHSIIGGAIATFAIPQIAGAAPVKDAAGALYIDGLTPSGRSTITFPDAQRTVSVNADACGRITIRNSSSTPLSSVTEIKLNGATVDTSTFSTDTLSRCVNGVPEINHPANFKLPDGSFILVGNTPLSRNSIAFPGVPLSRTVTVNACGFITLKTSSQYPLTGTLQIDGNPLDLSTVSTGNPPICKNNILYVPQ